MAIEYPVKMSVTLEPVGYPWVSVVANGWSRTTRLEDETEFSFEFTATESACLEVENFKKTDDDPTTAVIIKKISFFGITDPKFVWAGTYYPDYPAHYPDKIAQLPGQGYLGWNGVYRLDFSVPVFTWIHRIQSLGWMYQ